MDKTLDMKSTIILYVIRIIQRITRKMENYTVRERINWNRMFLNTFINLFDSR